MADENNTPRRREFRSEDGRLIRVEHYDASGNLINTDQQVRYRGDYAQYLWERSNLVEKAVPSVGEVIPPAPEIPIPRFNAVDWFKGRRFLPYYKDRIENLSSEELQDLYDDAFDTVSERFGRIGSLREKDIEANRRRVMRLLWDNRDKIGSDSTLFNLALWHDMSPYEEGVLSRPPAKKRSPVVNEAIQRLWERNAGREQRARLQSNLSVLDEGNPLWKGIVELNNLVYSEGTSKGLRTAEELVGKRREIYNALRRITKGEVRGAESQNVFAQALAMVSEIDSDFAGKFVGIDPKNIYQSSWNISNWLFSTSKIGTGKLTKPGMYRQTLEEIIGHIAIKNTDRYVDGKLVKNTEREIADLLVDRDTPKLLTRLFEEVGISPGYIESHHVFGVSKVLSELFDVSESGVAGLSVDNLTWDPFGPLPNILSGLYGRAPFGGSVKNQDIIKQMGTRLSEDIVQRMGLTKDDMPRPWYQEMLDYHQREDAWSSYASSFKRPKKGTGYSRDRDPFIRIMRSAQRPELVLGRSQLEKNVGRTVNYRGHFYDVSGVSQDSRFLTLKESPFNKFNVRLQIDDFDDIIMGRRSKRSKRRVRTSGKIGNKALAAEAATSIDTVTQSLQDAVTASALVNRSNVNRKEMQDIADRITQGIISRTGLGSMEFQTMLQGLGPVPAILKEALLEYSPFSFGRITGMTVSDDEVMGLVYDAMSMAASEVLTPLPNVGKDMAPNVKRKLNQAFQKNYRELENFYYERDSYTIAANKLMDVMGIDRFQSITDEQLSGAIASVMRSKDNGLASSAFAPLIRMYENDPGGLRNLLAQTASWQGRVSLNAPRFINEEGKEVLRDVSDDVVEDEDWLGTVMGFDSAQYTENRPVGSKEIQAHLRQLKEKGTLDVETNIRNRAWLSQLDEEVTQKMSEKHGADAIEAMSNEEYDKAYLAMENGVLNDYAERPFRNAYWNAQRDVIEDEVTRRMRADRVYNKEAGNFEQLWDSYEETVRKDFTNEPHRLQAESLNRILAGKKALISEFGYSREGLYAKVNDVGTARALSQAIYGDENPSMRLVARTTAGKDVQIALVAGETEGSEAWYAVKESGKLGNRLAIPTGETTLPVAVDEFYKEARTAQGQRLKVHADNLVLISNMQASTYRSRARRMGSIEQSLRLATQVMQEGQMFYVMDYETSGLPTAAMMAGQAPNSVDLLQTSVRKYRMARDGSGALVAQRIAGGFEAMHGLNPMRAERIRSLVSEYGSGDVDRAIRILTASRKNAEADLVAQTVGKYGMALLDLAPGVFMGANPANLAQLAGSQPLSFSIAQRAMQGVIAESQGKNIPIMAYNLSGAEDRWTKLFYGSDLPRGQVVDLQDIALVARPGGYSYTKDGQRALAHSQEAVTGSYGLTSQTHMAGQDVEDIVSVLPSMTREAQEKAANWSAFREGDLLYRHSGRDRGVYTYMGASNIDNGVAVYLRDYRTQDVVSFNANEEFVDINGKLMEGGQSEASLQHFMSQNFTRISDYSDMPDIAAQAINEHLLMDDTRREVERIMSMPGRAFSFDRQMRSLQEYAQSSGKALQDISLEEASQLDALSRTSAKHLESLKRMEDWYSNIFAPYHRQPLTEIYAAQSLGYINSSDARRIGRAYYLTMREGVAPEITQERAAMPWERHIPLQLGEEQISLPLSSRQELERTISSPKLYGKWNDIIGALSSQHGINLGLDDTAYNSSILADRIMETAQGMGAFSVIQAENMLTAQPTETFRKVAAMSESKAESLITRGLDLKLVGKQWSDIGAVTNTILTGSAADLEERLSGLALRYPGAEPGLNSFKEEAVKKTSFQPRQTFREPRGLAARVAEEARKAGAGALPPVTATEAPARTAWSEIKERAGRVFSSAIGEEGSQFFKAKGKGIAIAAGLMGAGYIFSNFASNGPMPMDNQPQHNQAPAPDGTYTQPMGSVGQRTVRVEQNGTGYQRMQGMRLAISGTDPHALDQGVLGSLVQEAIASTMPVDVRMNMNTTDNTNKLTDSWYQERMASAINGR